MSDGGDTSTTRAPAGWYPDPITPARRRYWTGSSWTYATSEPVPVDDAPPWEATPLPDGHRLPDPMVARPAPPTPAEAGPRKRPILWVLAVVVGLLVGVIGVALSTRSSPKAQPAASQPDLAAPGTTALPAPENTDPSAAALATLIVKPDDVPSTAQVVVFNGGIGLDQPTLDLCNGKYPSESRRAARFQDAALDSQGRIALGTEAVLYADSGGTTQAFAELRSQVAACPSTPVPGAAGEPAVTTRFNPAPDTGWAQVATVNRQAYDLTSVDAAGTGTHTVAVYLQRGRALLGVYFSQPDGPQLAVEGQTTIEGIVNVFAKRVAALPTSVVGA
jgi:uncharacterized protein DUF2510